MKPTLNMEGEKPAVIVTGLQQASRTETGKSSKIKRGFVIGAIAMVIVAVVVILSVFLGIKMTKDVYDESWQRYNTQDGKSVEEKVTKKDDSLDIHVPNEMDVVYDYKHGLVVKRFFDNEGKQSPCYASYMNSTLDPQPDSDANLKSSKTDLPKENQSETETWKFTEERVPSYMLSEDVRNMCSDTDVYWMTKTTSNVEKRGYCSYYYTRWYCYRYYYRYRICIFYVYCCNSRGCYFYKRYIRYYY